MSLRSRSTTTQPVEGWFAQGYKDYNSDGEVIAQGTNYYSCDIVAMKTKIINDYTSTIWPPRPGTVSIGEVVITSSERYTDGGGEQAYHYTWSDGSSRSVFTRACDSFTMFCIANAYYPPYNLIPDLPSKAPQAKFQCLKALDKPPQEFMEDVFEFKSTLQYIRNPLRSILDLANSLQRDIVKRQKRNKKFRALPRAKQFASVYLEHRFAFTPLLQSVEGAIDLCFQRLLVYPPIRQSKINLKSEFEQSLLGDNGLYKSMTTQKVLRIDSACIFYRSAMKNDFRSLAGLRLRDAPATLWAIFPYSFLIDRVIDISGAIKGITNLLNPDVNIVGAYTSTKIERILQRRITSRIRPPVAECDQWSATGDKVTDISNSYVRSLWVPTYLDAIPSFDLKGIIADALSIVDLCALIVQRLR